MDADAPSLTQLVSAAESAETSPERLGALRRLAATLENAPRPKNVDTLVSVRRRLEDLRVSKHAEMSAVALDPTTGLTEDACLFCVVAMCSAELAEVPGAWRHDAYECYADGSGPAGTHALALHAGTPARDLGPDALDDSFAALFQHCRGQDWAEDRGLHDLVTALTLRASVLLRDAVYGDPVVPLPLFAERRALWACASARLKWYALVTVRWGATVKAPGAPSPGEQGTEVRPTALRRFLGRALVDWDGPRLKEALVRAFLRRSHRLDEVGRTAAFAGGNSPCRSRGASDAAEDALHALDPATLLVTPLDRCVGALLSLRELLTLKILHNALEATAACDLMGRHVCLLSARTLADLDPTDPHVVRIRELPAGWIVTPGLADDRRATRCEDLEIALCEWYARRFPDSDPLELRSDRSATP